MENKKQRIFLTGATGVMGTAGLKELLKYPGNYDITVLARPSKKNRKSLFPYEKIGVKVIWGDLLEREALLRGIENSDIVLHVGGMVSPVADHYPEKTMKVNVGSMQLISGIVKEIEEREPEREIKVVYIGSVSQYGNRMPPNHWGKVGDALKADKEDAYPVSKIKAEEVLINSGIRKWVSIRQTSILHPGLLKKANDPVVFHTPLFGVLEWITTEDSGRLLERLCRPSVPDSFWGKCYNAGGGKDFRVTNLEFERGILKAMGCPPPEKIFEPNWFATRNFHGMWFEDSDALDDVLHFRKPDNFHQALARMKKELPFYFRLASVVPAPFIKAFMKRVASRPPLGTLSFIRNNDKKKIDFYWGSRSDYDKIPDWKNLKEIKLNREGPEVGKNS